MSISNIISLLGGLGAFLFGMKYMGDGLEMAAGSKMKDLLEKLTRNRFLEGAMPDTSRAIRTLVMAVPMLAPKMTPVAWARSMIPALIKPMTMTVVAEDD